ncbi:MAG: right-handed parallel beta-helix repeat-containing protein [Clostridia bacterium]|nr:right-handed parallel beta-helix repeat-containing protein [Clostridia bacterium]
MKTQRKALVLSIVALAVCFAMLVGSTFAWFTDTVSSDGNIIKSGTLNIDLGIKKKGDNDYLSVKQDPTLAAFNYDKWEPGYTEWVNAKVYTTGNLALKYTLSFTAQGDVSDLAEVIDVYYKAEEVAMPADRDLSALTKLGTLAEVLSGDVTIDDTLIPGENEEDFATLALHMQEEAGNEYQNKAIGATFSLKILATQYTYEEDSWDDQYDKDAEWPITADITVSNDTELAAAIESLNNSEYVNRDTPLVIYLKPGEYTGSYTVEQYPTEADWSENATYGTGVADIATADFNNVKFISNGETIMKGTFTVNGSNRSQSGFDYLKTGKASVEIEGITFVGELQEGDIDTIVVTVTKGANDVTFTNCTFKDQTHIKVGSASAEHLGTVVFDGCTFDKAACLSGYVYDIQVKNSTGNIDSGHNKGFVNIQSAGAVTIDNCNITLGDENTHAAYIVRTTSGKDVTIVVKDSTFAGTADYRFNLRANGTNITITNSTFPEGLADTGAGLSSAVFN